MKKRFAVIGSVLIFILAASHICLAVQIVRLNSAFSVLDEKTENALNEFEKQLRGYQSSLVSQIESMQSDVQMLADIQSKDAARIQGNLASIKKRADDQFSQTVSMKQTYDDILGEQKKKTVDTASQDSAVFQIKKEAERLYSEHNFAMAYKEFKKVLAYQNNDMESRLKKMKSLYYMNRADSSHHSEILDDIGILRSNGYCDSEADEIERMIASEREGLYE